MIIKREINGSAVEIELTDFELYNAYMVKQHMFDICDVEDAFNAFDDSELKDMYGLTFEEIKPKIPVIADEMRRNIDKYDMGWQEARDEAIREILVS